MGPIICIPFIFLNLRGKILKISRPILDKKKVTNLFRTCKICLSFISACENISLYFEIFYITPLKIVFRTPNQNYQVTINGVSK